MKHAAPEQIKHQTFLAVRDFLVALARRQPVILVCEDLHWADSLSLDLISLLMEALTLAPLMLLCVYRPERDHRCWQLASQAARKCPERFTEIHLRELSPQQSRRLVEALLAIENLPAAVKELILEKSRGNPFFGEEVLRSLIASGMVYQDGDLWRAREGIESVTVPESIQSVILSRVDRLSLELKQVLQNAAVIGRLFQKRVLQYTMQRGTELERALWELESQDLVYQERAVPEEEYSFQHVLTQETVYQSILRRRRAVFHQKVGEALEALYQEGLDEYYEQLAYHFERSGADEKAVEYLLKAGEKARRAYLYEAAISYFQRALERLEQPPLPETRKEWRLAALQGLGQIYQGTGKLAEADEKLREAITLGRELGLPAPQMARLFWWLGDVFWWENRFEDMVALGEEGLALLGGEAETVEAAMMIDTIAAGQMSLGNEEELWKRAETNAGFLLRLPYSEELRPAFNRVISLFNWKHRDPVEAQRWVHELRVRAEQHHDLRALCEAHILAAGIAYGTGDLKGKLRHDRLALETVAQTGDLKQRFDCLLGAKHSSHLLGDLTSAAEYAETLLRTAEAMGNELLVGVAWSSAGEVALCRGAGSEALEALTRAVQVVREDEPSSGANPSWVGWVNALLGRAYLSQGSRPEAVRYLKTAAALEASMLPWRLGWLEEAWDDSEAFRAFCRQLRAEHPEVVKSGFAHWHLEAAESHAFARAVARDGFAGALSADWVWHDPSQDCRFTAGGGLEIQAANGRGLWYLDLTAPRLLRTVSGDFGMQAVCVPVSAETPAIGGLLLWKDRDNFLRLTRGVTARHDASLSGCVKGNPCLFGRGRLAAERLFLRMERLGGEVSALCSADGQSWFSVGSVELAVDDPVEVGVHALGEIDRTIYPGAHLEGAAIRFESFELWGAE